MVAIFDSHAHYNDERFDCDRDVLLNKMNENGVCGIINVGVDIKTSFECIELANKYPFIWAAVGIYPHNSIYTEDDYLENLKKMLEHKKVVAIGEIGLDYHYDESPRELQKKFFEEQLALATQYDIPVIIHSREAFSDTLSLLSKYRPKGVVHCFSGSQEIMNEIIKLNMYIGLGGSVTFKNAKHPLTVAKNVPLKNLLLETDCPYMAPVPFRGKRCNSSMISYTANKIAELKGMDVNELLSITSENVYNLFSKIKN